MKYVFANGTDEQKQLWLSAVHRLLHFPFDDIPLTVNVSFVDPSEIAGQQTDLARTTWTYGSAISDTQVRNDAPGFGPADAGLEALAASMGLTYSATKHFHETAVHELGHSLYAALPEEARVAIAQMFGAESDDTAELQPEDVPWEERRIEGIAETFKEAFLPRRFRVFPNRSKVSIPYSRFPEFRAHFRSLRERKGGSEEVAPSWYRTPRVDALRYGAKGGFPIALPFDAPEKGDFGSGVYFRLGTVFNEFGEEWSEGDGPKFIKEYDGGAAAQWMGLLEDPIEAREPIVVPPETFFEIPSLEAEGYSYVGGSLFEIVNPEAPFPPFLGFSLGRFWLHIGVEVQDEDGVSYEINWLINVQFSAWTNTETEEKIWGFADESIQYFRKNGSLIAQVPFSTGPSATFSGYAMSAADIFAAFEGKGETPKYEPGAVLSFRTGIENFVVYEFPFPENHELEELKSYAWSHMHSMWVAPLSSEPGEEEEGDVIEVEVPTGQLQPGGASSGRHPSVNSSGGGTVGTS